MFLLVVFLCCFQVLGLPLAAVCVCFVIARYFYSLPGLFTPGFLLRLFLHVILYAFASEWTVLYISFLYFVLCALFYRFANLPFIFIVQLAISITFFDDIWRLFFF